MSLPSPPAAPTPPSTEKPHFEIQVEDGRGLLHLRPRTFYGWLRVDSLQLAIPEVQFPLDITGGMAQFQRQKCALLEATLKIERAGVNELLARRARLLTAAGFEEVDLALDARGVELAARVRLREWAAELSARIAVEVDERVVRLRVVEAMTFGFLRRPAPLVAHDLMCVLLGATPSTGEGEQSAAAIARGLGHVELKPLEWFAVSVLAPAGWRLPDLDGVRLAGLTLGEKGAELRWQRDARPARTGEPPATLNDLAARAIDDALLRNDLAGAATACRMEMARRPERAAALTERLLGILCARDASLREAETLARDALQRWPELGAAYLALAAIETSRGRATEAARAFSEAARLGEANGNVTLAVRAAAAAARQLQATDPPRAALLYEHVLQHRPTDREATDALVDLYAGAGRWGELRGLLQARLQSARDDAERVEAHLRVAELSFAKLRDAQAARADLEAAARLAPEDRRVWSLLASAHAQLGDTAECIVALEKLAAVLQKSGDTLAEARALLRIAGYYEDLNDDAAALARYRRALELTPDDAAAIERFAAAAARYGDAADAIAAYEQLLKRPDGRDGAGRRRRAEQQLFQLLVIIGDRDRARALLPSLSDEPSPDALSGLARLEEACDDLGMAAELWARAAAQLEGQHAAAAELERARVCHAAGHVAEEQASLTRAFALMPTGPEGVTAASGLIRLARAAGDTAAEAQWLDRLLACDAPGTPRWAELALRRAQLHVDAGDAAGAARVLDALSAAGHDGPAARRLAADVRGAVGDARGRAAALEALAADVDGAERARLLVQAAESRLAVDDIDAAEADVRIAEPLLPEAVEVRLAVAEIAWRRHAWEEVATLYGELADPQEAGAAPSSGRVEQLRRQAVAIDRLGRPHEALGILSRALESGGDGEALGRAARELGQLHERMGDAAAAVAVYKRAGADAQLPSGARAALLRAAAETAYRRLHDHESAAATLQAALEIDPRDLQTLDALDALQAELGDVEGALATLQRKLTVPDAPVERRREWLERLGEMSAARGRSDAARAAFGELAALDPHHAGALRWLAADAAARDDEAAADAYEARLVAERNAVPLEEQRAVRLRLAARARKELRLGDAETHLWAAVELTPSHEQSPLLTTLEEVYLQGGRYADLVVILNHHAQLVDDATRLELDLQRIALLTRELGTPNVAVDEAQAALARHGRSPRLLGALAQAARTAGQRALLAETLAAQAGMTVDARERGQLNAEAASLYRQLGDTARAEELAREIAAEDVPPAERLALAEIVPDQALALTLARAAVAALPAGEERQRALRLVALRAQGLDDAAELAALEALFADGQLEVRPRLTELLLDVGRDEDAAPHLLELLRAEAGAGLDTGTLLARLRHVARGPAGACALAEALVLLSARAKQPQQAVTLLREAARLRADRDDFAGAADALHAALAYAPGDALLVADLMTMLGDLGLGQRLREVLELHLSTLAGEARLPILRKLLPLVEELGDAPAAAELLAEMRRLEPQAAARVNVRALQRMVAPGGRGDGELRARIADLQSRLQQLPAEAVEQQRTGRLKLAQLFRDAGRLADAYDQTATVLAEEPGNVTALRLQVEIAESDGRWLDAAQALDRLSYLLPTAAERAAALSRAGELHLLRLNDKDAASDCFLKAIDLLPTHAPTLRRLIDYFWSTGDEASAAEMAAALDDEGGFAAAETTLGTRARAALATAYAGDARRAVRFGAALDDAAAAALAPAALELAARGDDARVAQALRQLFGAGARLSTVRLKLEESGEAAATALAAKLG